MGQGRDNPYRFVAPLLIVLAGVLAYYNCLHGAFIFDDRPSILDNPRIHQIWPLTSSMKTQQRLAVSARPVVQLSFAINYAIGDLNPTVFHAWNLGVHICCGLLIYGICRRLMKIDVAALAAALIFVVHPLNSECVDYVMQRSESMMAMFALLTAYCFIRRWYVMSVIACALGMGCKEPMAAVPVLVLAMDRIFISGSWKGLKWPVHLALFATLGVMAYLQSGNPHGEVFIRREGLNSWSYLLTETGVVGHYLKLVFWPRPLVLDYYDWTLAKSFGEVLPWTVLELSLAGLTVMALFKYPRAGFAGLCFFLVLAPSSSVLPLNGEFASERRMYLPMAVLVPLFVFVAWQWMRKVPISFNALLVALIVVPLSWMCVQRNNDYRSEERIWTDTVQKRPANARAWANLASVYDQKSRSDDAMMAAEKATALDPGLGPTHRLLGTLLSKKGQHEEAILHLRAAMQTADNAFTRREIGLAYERSGDDKSALQWLSASKEMKADAVTENELGFVLARGGRIDEAQREFEAAIAKNPRLADAHYNLGLLLAMRGDVKRAVNELHQTIELNPKRYDAMTRLAWIVATTPDEPAVEISQALNFAKRAYDVGSPGVEILDTYAAILARSGDFKQAVLMADRAKELALKSGDARLAEAIEKRLDGYRHSQPYLNERTASRTLQGK